MAARTQPEPLSSGYADGERRLGRPLWTLENRMTESDGHWPEGWTPMVFPSGTPGVRFPPGLEANESATASPPNAPFLTGFGRVSVDFDKLADFVRAQYRDGVFAGATAEQGPLWASPVRRLTEFLGIELDDTAPFAPGRELPAVPCGCRRTDNTENR